MKVFTKWSNYLQLWKLISSKWDTSVFSSVYCAKISWSNYKSSWIQMSHWSGFHWSWTRWLKMTAMKHFKLALNILILRLYSLPNYQGKKFSYQKMIRITKARRKRRMLSKKSNKQIIEWEFSKKYS
jgi:hypothetical protein